MDDRSPKPELPTVNSATPSDPAPLKVGTAAVRTGKSLYARRPTYMNKRVAAVVAIVLVAGLAGYGGGQLGSKNDTVFDSGSLSTQKQVVTSQSQLIRAIASSVGPSVVSVNVQTTAESSNFFGYSQPQTEEAAGTGIIISKDGVIMTNRHVVPAGITSVSVTLSDGTTFDDVKVLGRTSASDSLDVAFLKISDLKGKKLVSATIGNSSQASVGDSVVAIGNALGQFQNTVTSGIVSGFGRSVEASDGGGGAMASASTSEDLDNLIQTDAAINEGNSGGPLVNMNGQVIGINTAIASNAENIGFAIPINDVKGLILQVLKTGTFKRPYLGVRFVQVTGDIAKQYGLSSTSGAYVVPQAISGQDPVAPGSPADKAGLQAGDIITKVNSDNVTQAQGLTTLLNRYQPGDSVKITVERGGKTITISVTLGSSTSS